MSRTRPLTVHAERFTLAKFVVDRSVLPPALVLAACSPGIDERSARRLAAQASIGSGETLAQIERGYSVLLLDGQVVVALYQPRPDPRGSHYLAAHYLVTDESIYRQLGYNFRYLVDLLPLEIQPQGAFIALSRVEQQHTPNSTAAKRVVQQALDTYGAGVLARLLEPWYTGMSAAHIAFNPDPRARLDLLEALTLLAPRPLRTSMSFATAILDPADSPYRVKFVPRPMMGLEGHQIFLWQRGRPEVIGGVWDEDGALRRCCEAVTCLHNPAQLRAYLTAVDTIDLPPQTASTITTADWDRLLEDALPKQF